MSGPASVKNDTNNPNPNSRYSLRNDVPDLEPIDLSAVEAVVPVVEERTRAGNKNPYSVNGKTYRLMESEIGYEEVGVASWYGRKFHGHLTSNGEIYDMFQLTAAHKTLPIPGYLKVTNLDNNKSVIVRVNDRGPFHNGRVVDLSYAAASMLDYADKGTARVKVEALVPTNQAIPNRRGQALALPIVAQTEPLVIKSMADQGALDAGLADNEIATISVESIAAERENIDKGRGQEYLQVGAFSNLDSAQGLVNKLVTLTSLPVFIRSEVADNSNNLLHRVRLGPLNETIELGALIQDIINADLGNPFKIRQ